MEIIITENTKVNENMNICINDLENNIVNMEDNINKLENNIINIELKESIQKYFNKNKNLNSIERKKIFIYGCSHCKCFIRDNILINNILIINKFRSAASMSGVVNDISTLNYKKDITKNILIYKNDYHVFKFGQVDIEYIYLYKTFIKKNKIEKTDFYNDIIGKYIIYLKNYIDNFTNKILVCGSNLTNPYNWEKYVKSILKISKLPENISCDSKNKDVLLFNTILKKACINNNITYFDTTEKCSINKDDVTILRNKYVGRDHHYSGAELEDTFKKENKDDKKYGYDTYCTFLEELFKNIT